jgi:hypothetical protein
LASLPLPWTYLQVRQAARARKVQVAVQKLVVYHLHLAFQRQLPEARLRRFQVRAAGAQPLWPQQKAEALELH